MRLSPFTLYVVVHDAEIPFGNLSSKVIDSSTSLNFTGSVLFVIADTAIGYSPAIMPPTGWQ